jgi:hypothetical protein
VPQLFTNQEVLLPEFARAREESPFQWTLKDMLFEDCTIIGPAVITTGAPDAFLIEDPVFPGLGDDRWAVLWRLDPEQDVVIGAIGVSGCAFVRCSFYGVGFAAGPETIQELLSAFG